jgi:hypothetical protein
MNIRYPPNRLRNSLQIIRKSHAWFSRREEKTLKSDKISPSENNYYVGGRGGWGLVMYLIRRYHVVNNNYSHSLFPYSHFFFFLGPFFGCE